MRASDIKAPTLKKEIKKSDVKDRILKGYAYRLCISGELTPRDRTNWEALLENHAKAIYKDAKKPMVLGSNQVADWMRLFPGVLRQIRPDLVNGFMFSEFARQATRDITQYVDVPAWQPKIVAIRPHVDLTSDARDVLLAITGKPGTGKTRLVYEALAAVDDLAGLVVYTAQEQQADEIGHMLAISADTRAILVADKCSIRCQERLWELLQSERHRVRIIAIENADDRAPSAQHQILPMSDGTVRQILEQNFPDIPADRRYVYVDYAGAYLPLASELCRFDAEIAERGTLAPVSVTVDRLLRARLPDPGQADAIEALSLLHSVGYKDDVSSEMDYLCATVPHLTREKLQQTAEDLHNSTGFVTRAGRYYFVYPEIIARMAFERAWNRFCAPDFRGFLARMHPDLFEPFLARVKDCESDEIRRIVGTAFIGATRSFGLGHLVSERDMRFILILCEIWPAIYLPILRKIIEEAKPEELLAIGPSSGVYYSPRRLIVSFCENVAVFPDCFDDAEAILLRLALAENEPTIANNATGVWKDLFDIALSNTGVPFAQRLDRLKRYILMDDPAVPALALDALDDMLNMPMAGPITQLTFGGRFKPSSWRPETDGELWACFDDGLDVLISLAYSENGELRRRAERMAISHIHIVLLYGCLPKLQQMFDPQMLSDDLRADIVEAIEDSVHVFEARRNPAVNPEQKPLSPEEEQYVAEIRSWAEMLRPTSVHGRIRLAAGPNPWALEFRKGETARDEELASLAKALIEEPAILHTEMAWLCSAEAQGAGYLGLQLGKLDVASTLMRVVVEGAITHEGSALARGYFSGFLDTRPGMADLANRVLDDPESSAPRLAYELALIGKLAPQFLGGFIHILVVEGFHHEQLRQALEPLVVATENGDQRARQIALDYVGRAIFAGRELIWRPMTASPELAELVWRLLSSVTETGTTETHEWLQIAQALVEADAGRIAHIAASAASGEDYGLGNAGMAVLSGMAKLHSAEVMAAVGEIALDSDRGRLFWLHKFESVFRLLSAQIVIDWVTSVGIEGAIRIARHLPHPTLDEAGGAECCPYNDLRA